ncbi:hypothetical protein A5893_14370 [Pedobacter psychrophilus]|uniref:Glycosyltransferase n=1 Tax=Pedobacter psychrophilus TaxID=1826909 RepID=A0A179DC15_9SPHI|nr:hypothetical protein A5893_14370 [Pedobacter psychrophilus]
MEIEFNLKNILIISPAFPTATNGLGDYSEILGSKLAEEIDFQIFYAGLGQKESVSVKKYIEVNKKNNLNQIVKEHSINLVFLNYSNYGYQKRGVPFWLWISLASIKKQNIAIITFFHEIYASGNFRESSFWLKPAQVFLFKKIYQLSDNVFCSNEVVLNLIQQQTEDGGVKTKNIGIFSNIPELGEFISWDDRKPYAVVFGTLGRRNSIYKNIPLLNDFIIQNNILKIFDIGDGELNINESSLNIPLIKCGKISLFDISQILAQSQWGFIDYPNKLLGKSGIFAAYCAYGLAILNFVDDTSNTTDDLILGKNLISMSTIPRQVNGKDLSINSFNWYVNRNLNIHAHQIIKTIKRRL